MEDFYYAGGVPALMGRIKSLLDLDSITITGRTLAENISGHVVHNEDIIRPVDNPLDPEGGLAVLYGNIAPTGAIIKPTAASQELMVHKGKAIVFEDHEDLGKRIDDPDLEVFAGYHVPLCNPVRRRRYILSSSDAFGLGQVAGAP